MQEILPEAMKREQCRNLREILEYRHKHGEFPPEYEKLNMSDKLYLNQLLYVEYLAQQEESVQVQPAEKKISIEPDDDLWEEDEDEYRLYGERRI